MPLDTGVFDRAKTFDDYRQAEAEFQLKKQLAAAQIAKYQELDADKLGEQAFLKAAQGMPLSSQETAALRYIDAKSPTSAFNPVTGNMEVKPSLLDRAGLGGVPAPASSMPMSPKLSQPMTPDSAASVVDLFGDSGQPVADSKSEWDLAYDKEMANATGNPRLQQSIMETYAKKKLDMNGEESKAATYADRAALAEQVMSDPTKVKAFADPNQKFRNSITPFPGTFGNWMNNDDYNSFDQAQKNFETAKLRQESGATINPSEFATDERTLLPRASDSPELIAQKKANRDAIIRGLQRQAGPAYKSTKINPVSRELASKIANGTIADNPKTGESLIYMDGAWKPLNGRK